MSSACWTNLFPTARLLQSRASRSWPRLRQVGFEADILARNQSIAFDGRYRAILGSLGAFERRPLRANAQQAPSRKLRSPERFDCILGTHTPIGSEPSMPLRWSSTERFLSLAEHLIGSIAVAGASSHPPSPPRTNRQPRAPQYEEIGLIALFRPTRRTFRLHRRLDESSIGQCTGSPQGCNQWRPTAGARWRAT